MFVLTELEHPLDGVALLASVAMVSLAHLAEDVPDLLVVLTVLIELLLLSIRESLDLSWKERVLLEHCIREFIDANACDLAMMGLTTPLVVEYLKHRVDQVSKPLGLWLKDHHAPLIGEGHHSLVAVSVVFEQDGELVSQYEILGLL